MVRLKYGCLALFDLLTRISRIGLNFRIGRVKIHWIPTFCVPALASYTDTAIRAYYGRLALFDTSELTDEDEEDENEVNTGDIIVNDVPGGVEVRTGSSFQPEPSASFSCSTSKSRKKLKRHQSLWTENKSPHYAKQETQDELTASDLF
ncbi:hypothetical protein TNCV_2193081 [Trichonephila clavipes]|nr:hypothetical protein TNCV_2193081 [Trichonephila clavipes]